jgi:hypothetical protein
VWPVMAAIFAGLVGWSTAGAVLLYLGLALSLAASVEYVRTARAQLRAARERKP